jgi:hypothetical protein
MSFWSRLFGRSAAAVMAPPVSDPLVEEPRRSATRLGGTPLITPWSTTRLLGIFQEWQRNPSYGSLMEARLARQCLSQFWLSAPVDQLELLYRSPIGECYRQLLASGLARETLLPQEQGWKDTLAQRLATAFERPETTNVLLAAMPYFPSGKMRVADPLQQIPGWLQEDYARLFDPGLLQVMWKPAALLNPVGQSYGPAPTLGVQSRGQAAPAAAPAPQFNARPVLPRLSATRGAQALALVQSPDYLNRMGGLINLFVIDPQDQEVQAQLVELRRQLGQIWLDAQPAQLQDLYSSAFGQLYQDLLACGFPGTPLSPEDRMLRNKLARLVADMSQPGAINALMAVLPFYGPGKLAFGGGEQHMPRWLLSEIATIYGERPPAAGPQTAEPSGETPAR